MGIEEIKKAKEEAKKTITRPSQKVPALLIALGATTASEILKNIKDEVIGVGVRYASNFSLEVQLNEYDKKYLENSKVIFEAIPLNNKRRLICQMIF